MTKPRTVDYLQPDETAILQVRRHPLSAVDGFLGLAALGALALIAALVLARQPALDAYAANIWTALAVVEIVIVWAGVLLHWRRATSLYSVTGERVYMAYGRLRFNLLQTTYDKVTDMHVYQSLFGRIWGYGTVRVQTAGTGLALAGVVSPLEFKQRIETERTAFLHALVGTAKPAPRRSNEPVADVHWTGRPSGSSLLGGLVAAFALAAAATILVVVGLFVTTEAIYAGAALAVMALATGWGQWILYRYTAFQIDGRGVVVTRGWISRRRVEATFAKVTDVEVAQGILGRLLGYGKITINTAGSNEAPVVFSGIADPDDVKRIIDEARGS